MKFGLTLIIVCVLLNLSSATWIDADGSLQDSLPDVISRGDEEVCGTAQMYYTWSMAAENDRPEPRFTEIYFLYNGTFRDNSFGIDGQWLVFGEGGDDIMVFRYPSTTYVSPNNSGSGTMFSRNAQICGEWYFDNLKWYCPNVCTE